MTSLRLLLVLLLCFPSLIAAGWKAGAAKANITPRKPIWMAGYGGRTAPDDGVLHQLWAKVLALEDAQGRRAMIIATDTLGMTASLHASLKPSWPRRIICSRRRS